MTKVVSTRISETEHKKFLNKCNDLGCNSADLLRDIVLEFLNEESVKENKLIPKAIVTSIDGKPVSNPIPKADVKVIWE